MHRDTPDERLRCAPDVEKQTRFRNKHVLHRDTHDTADI